MVFFLFIFGLNRTRNVDSLISSFFLQNILSSINMWNIYHTCTDANVCVRFCFFIFYIFIASTIVVTIFIITVLHESPYSYCFPCYLFYVPWNRSSSNRFVVYQKMKKRMLMNTMLLMTFFHLSTSFYSIKIEIDHSSTKKQNIFVN